MIFIILWLALFAFLSMLLYPQLKLFIPSWTLLFTYILAYHLRLDPLKAWSLLVILLSACYALHLYMQRAKGSLQSTKSAPSLLGNHFTLEKPIVSGKGNALLQNKRWTLHGPDLPVGALVTITTVIDGILIVDAHQR